MDAVTYFRIANPIASVCNVEDTHRSTKLLAQTSLRNELGTKNLSDILSDRDSISQSIQQVSAFGLGTDQNLPDTLAGFWKL